MRRAACLQRPRAPLRQRRTHGAELTLPRTMLLCRPGVRLSAAASVQTNKPAGWFLERVRARQTQGDVTLTLRKGTTFQGYRYLCAAAAGDSGRLCSGKQKPLPDRDSPPGPGLTDWAHWSRSLALSLSTAKPGSAFIRRPLLGTDRRFCGGGEPSVNVLFSGSFRLLSTQHCTSGTRTMQSRSASTSSKDAGEADNKAKEVTYAARVYQTSCWVFGFRVSSLGRAQSGPPWVMGVKTAYATVRDVHLRVHVPCINGSSSVIDSDSR